MNHLLYDSKKENNFMSRCIPLTRLALAVSAAAFLLPLSANAQMVESNCRYDHLPQGDKSYQDIILTAPDSQRREWRDPVTDSGHMMPTWVEHYEPYVAYANSAEFDWRRARLLDKEYIEKTEARYGEEHDVRYYAAYTENCRSLFLRVPVDSSPFSDQLRPMDDASDGSLDFSPLQNSLDMILQDDWDKLNDHVGKPVTVVANAEGGVPLISEDRSRKGYATPMTWFTLIGTSRHPLVIDERKLSGIHLLVKDVKGTTWRLPWLPDRLYLGNPLAPREVREAYHEDIREGRLADGMNREEVELVTGPPTWERRYPIFTSAEGNGRYVIDEGHRQDGLMKNLKSLPNLSDTPIGEEMGWFFPEILGEETYLRFNEKGFLDAQAQPAGHREWWGSDWHERYLPEEERSSEQ